MLTRTPIPRHNARKIDKRFFTPLRRLLGLKYFQLDIEGDEHLPREGNILFVANHSGWVPLDALFLLYAIHKSLGPDYLPYLLVHPLLIRIPFSYNFLKTFGLIPSDWLHYGAPPLPESLNPIAIFPEGADGNSKPFWQAYHMKAWKTGFVRLAIQRQAQVVPVAIVGGEEALPVAITLKALKPLLGSVAPLPLLLAPLPSRWKITFLKPIDFSAYAPELALDQEACQEIAQKISERVQEELEEATILNPLSWLSSWIDTARRT
jgi:1-acyl-sn-glycerol-3-phosphate acyltransferase